MVVVRPLRQEPVARGPAVRRRRGCDQRRNGKKPNQTVRVGDVVVVPQGGWQRTVRVLALGLRRGPAAEARTLYEEAAMAAPRRDTAPDWVPLLDADDPAESPSPERYCRT